MGGYIFNPIRISKEENTTVSLEIAQDIGHGEIDEMDKKKLLSIYRKIPLEQIIECRPDRTINRVHNKNI